jgi:hypothetical protein
MQPWQIELIKAFGLMVVAFLGGYGTNWLKNRDRMAELASLKAKQRFEGQSEAARLERAARLSELMIMHKQNQISPDDFEDFHDKILNKRRRKVTKPALKDQSKQQEAFGPNGGKISILPNGDTVETFFDDDLEEETTMILLRGESQIQDAEHEFYEKVWWSRNQLLMDRAKEGKGKAFSEETIESASNTARRIEATYGIENLGWDDFGWGMVCGKLSALRWVLGSEWDMLDS